MSLPNIQNLSLDTEATQRTTVAPKSNPSNEHAVTDGYAHDEKDAFGVSTAAVVKYLMAKSLIYRKLQRLREEGWKDPRGDEYFAKQRREMKQGSDDTATRINAIMKRIAREMNKTTKAFAIESQTEPQRILDLCMAPGSYLDFALKINPTAHAVAFTLPPEQGGLVPVVEASETVSIHMLDINMLAADMGVCPDDIPESHPDAANFLHSRYLEDGRDFDLVICDGAVFRITQDLASHRVAREPRRLFLAQMAMGLEHLREGGTMIVLLHKVDGLNTIRLLRDFHNFAKVVLFKPESGHAKRSSFYMIASNVQSADPKAIEAVREWKREWKLSTIGTDEEWQDECARAAGFGELGIKGVLEEFGPTLVKLAHAGEVWKRQFDALSAISRRGWN